MEIEQIKEYLKQPRLEFNSTIEDNLKKSKEDAVSKGNENLANEIWYLQQIYDIQKNIYMHIIN